MPQCLSQPGMLNNKSLKNETKKRWGQGFGVWTWARIG
jgi:hypothetical protein